MNEEALMEAGLTHNEAKVYLAMLQLGSSSVNDITRKAGVHRVNAYDILERLREKGLVSTLITKGKRFYNATNPQQLLKILEAKEAHIKGVLPELMLEFTMKKEKPEVYYFKGPDGVMTAYNMMLEQGDKLLYGMGGSGMNRKYLKHRHHIWEAERKKRGIKLKCLYFEKMRGTKIGDEDWDIRFLPNEFHNPVMFDIIGKLVLILIATDDIMAVVIENQLLADAYRKYFKMLWDYVAKK